MALRQALHFPGRLSPWPALFPSNYTSCSATSSVLSARGGGGRLRCGCYAQEDGWGTTPSEAQPWEASEEPLWRLPPSAVWPRAPGSEWADGAQDQNGHGPILFFPFQATKASMWPPWPSLLSTWYPRVPLDLEVSPGASRSRPEIGQVTHLYPWLLQPPSQQALSPPGQGAGTALLQVLRCPGSPFAGSHLAGKEQAWAVNVA